MRALCALLLAMLVCAPLSAQPGAQPARFEVRGQTLQVDPAPVADGRFQLRSGLTPRAGPSADPLMGVGLVLHARLVAKTTGLCPAPWDIFKDGFED
jgi:hypothetical protein